MQSEYHIEIVTRAIGEHFSESALAEIIKANLGQDDLRHQFGNKSHYHFDNNELEKSAEYVTKLHLDIKVMAGNRQHKGRLQRQAFGKLSHAIQDFYAHSNYVRLWLERNGGIKNTTPQQIEAQDPAIMADPNLKSGSFLLWRDAIYFLPVWKHIARAVYVPKDSHEEMNLDTPERGELFAYAMEAAIKRTQQDYLLAREAILTEGGQRGLDIFHGQ